MPIVWKTQFTFPFILQCLAGKVKGPKSFASTLATQYDLCIKTGFPMVGVPPVPFMAGKKILLQIAIMIGMLELLLLVLKILNSIKGGVTKDLIKTKKQLADQLNIFNKELSAIQSAYSDNVKDLVETLDNNNQPGSPTQITVTLNGNSNTGFYASVVNTEPCDKNFVIPLTISQAEFDNYNDQLALGTTPTSLLGEIKTSTLNAFNLNSDLINEFNENAKSSLDEDILATNQQMQKINFIQLLKNLLKAFAKKINIFSVIFIIPLIIKSLVTAHTKPITEISKKITELQGKMGALDPKAPETKIQRDILKKNLKLLSLDLGKAQLRLGKVPKIALNALKINPLKFLKFPAPNIKLAVKEANEMLQKRLTELSQQQSELSEQKAALKSDKKKLNEVNAAVNKAIAEASQLLGPNQQPTLTQIQSALQELLKCKQLSDADKLAILSAPTSFDTNKFIGTLSDVNKNGLNSIDKDIIGIKAEKNLLNSLIKGNALKVKGFEFDRNVKLFNIALNVGLLAYWIGGVIPAPPGVATVLLPGIPPTLLGLNVSFKGPQKFFTSLESIFQAHAATVAGIYTTPTPSVTPWFGYY